jgi:hypothetical protein
MGVNGALVGGLFNGATNAYYEGAEPKKDAEEKEAFERIAGYEPMSQVTDHVSTILRWPLYPSH